MRRRSNPWFSVGADFVALGLEAGEVMALRSLKLMRGGPGSTAEARLMVEEKVAAALELQRRALSGSLGSSAHGAASGAVKHYRRKVKANRRRLKASR